MKWSDITTDPSPRTLRQFAGLWLLFFGGLACWQSLARGRPALGTAMAVLALGVGLLGLLRPRIIRPIYVGWMIAAFPVGWVVSQLLLAAIFYGVFTPIGFCLRATGWDLLGIHFQQNRETYWISKPMPHDVRRYFLRY